MAPPSPSQSPSLVWFDGRWSEGNPGVLGPRSHSLWQGSAVFDGARHFEGVCPDLSRHCQRCVDSARIMGLAPPLSAEDIVAIAREGIGRFCAAHGPDSQIYVQPTLWAEDGLLIPVPESTRFAMVLFAAPLPAPQGFTAIKSSFRRPARDMAPTAAKAACLYPNIARCLREAAARGRDTAVVLDPWGHVAEFAYTNLFFAKNGVVHTPAASGVFLNGLTRQRVIALLRGAGVEVAETTVDFEDVLAADEVFSTGNYAKVLPCVEIEGKTFGVGPLCRKARALYWEFATSGE